MLESPLPHAVSNPITSRAVGDAQRAAAETDPGRFHGNIAKRELRWYDSQLDAWITWSDEHKAWTGFNATTGEQLPDLWDNVQHEPWQRAFNRDDAPLFRWFEGGLTNACFNEVDQHVLAAGVMKRRWCGKATGGTWRATADVVVRSAKYASRANNCCSKW